MLRCCRPARPTADESLEAVVPLQQAAELIDPRTKLMQLEGQQAAVAAQLDDVGVQFLLQPPHHLQPLGHEGEIAHRYLILNLQ